MTKVKEIRFKLDLGQRDFSREDVAHLLALVDAAEAMQKLIQPHVFTFPPGARRELTEALAAWEAAKQDQAKQAANETDTEIRDCQKCNGAGRLKGEHLPGFIHYETDAGEECPAYHFSSVQCGQCKGSGKNIAMMAERKESK